MALSNYNANLYTRTDPKDAVGADILVPKHNSTVDVHGSYAWTLSPASVRSSVPAIELTEYKQMLSSEVTGFFYGLAGKVDDARQIAAAAPTLATETGKTVNNFIKQAGTSAANAVPALFGYSPFGKGTVDATTQQNVAQAEDKKAKNAPSEQASQDAKKQEGISSGKYDRNLLPYAGLYAIEPTGWVYRMPFLTSSNMMSPTNNWGNTATDIKDALGEAFGKMMESSKSSSSNSGGSGGGTGGGSGGSSGGGSAGGGKKGVLGAVGELVGKYGGNAMDVAMGMTAGAKVKEIPMSFSGTNNDSVQVSFYLYNTLNFADIRKNWELCYLLTYQNLPNRKGINLLDPPCLYKVLIPGYKQLPLSYVSAISIENKGAVRLIDIVNGKDLTEFNDTVVVNSDIKMIPEAYKVSITFNSVLMNSRNIFTYGEDPDRKVSVSTSSTV